MNLKQHAIWKTWSATTNETASNTKPPIFCNFLLSILVRVKQLIIPRGKPRQLPDANKRDETLEILWKVLSELYFSRIQSKDTKVLEHILETYLSESGHFDTNVPIFRDSEALQTVVELVNKGYEQVYGSENKEFGRHNFMNLLKSYFLTLTYYLPLLQKKKAKRVILLVTRLEFNSSIRSLEFVLFP